MLLYNQLDSRLILEISAPDPFRLRKFQKVVLKWKLKPS